MTTVLISILILTTVITLIVGVVTWFILKSYTRQIRQALEPLAAATGSEVVLFRWKMRSQVTGSHQGLPFLCEYQAQSRGAPPFLTITAPMVFPFHFSIRRRNWFDRLGATLGLAITMPSGDESFDGSFQIITNDILPLVPLLSQHQARECFTSIFEGPLAKMEFSPTGAALTIKLEPSAAVKPSQVSDYLYYLEQLARLVPGIKRKTAVAPLRVSLFNLYLALPLVFFLVAGLALTIAGTELYPPLFPSLVPILTLVWPYAFGLLLVYLAVCWPAVRTYTNRHEKSALIIGLGLPAFFLLLMGLGYFTNGFLDTSPVRENKATVHEIFTKGRGSRRMSFNVAGRVSTDFPRPDQSISKGEPVIMQTRDGYWDIPWVSQWHLTR